MFLRGSQDDKEENKFLIGVTAFGIVAAFLLSLVLIRILVNVFIDVTIAGGARRASWLQFWLPSWSGSRNIVTESPDHLEVPGWRRRQDENDVLMDRMLTGLPKDEKISLISTWLKSKVKTLDNIEDIQLEAQHQHIPAPLVSGNSTTHPDRRISSLGANKSIEQVTRNGSNEPNEENAISSADQTPSGLKPPICPICINDLFSQDSEAIMLNDCKHYFHRQCLCQWLSTHSRDCPYCRTEIISKEMLLEAAT